MNADFEHVGAVQYLCCESFHLTVRNDGCLNHVISFIIWSPPKSGAILDAQDNHLVRHDFWPLTWR